MCLWNLDLDNFFPLLFPDSKIAFGILKKEKREDTKFEF